MTVESEARKSNEDRHVHSKSELAQTNRKVNLSAGEPKKDQREAHTAALTHQHWCARELEYSVVLVLEASESRSLHRRLLIF